MKYKRYTGGFNSVAGVAWRLEIWQEASSAYVVKEIAFADTPVTFDWAETDKIEPVQSSSATVELYSDSDRQFKDLYSVKVGDIRLDAYRDNLLYWSGTLDTELFEEPFSYKSGYTTTVTFSDFAILERFNFDQTGFKTLSECIALAASTSQINFVTIVEHISTKTDAASVEDITDEVSVSSGNFYDEDGEPTTIRKFIEDVLKPLSLRMIQREGNIIVYDLNHVATTFTPQLIVWQADDAVLSADKVYNNVRVTFSPYEKTDLLDAKIMPESITDAYPKMVRTNYEHDGTTLTAPEGFKVHLSETAEGKVAKGANCKFFKFEPIYSGTEDAGVAFTFKNQLAYYTYVTYINEATNTIGSLALQPTENPYLADVGFTQRLNYRLRVNLDLLFDTRYNPFEDAEYWNENGDYDDLKNWCNFAYVPIILTLRDANGTALFHYVNKMVYESNNYVNTLATWSYGEGSWGDAYLAYYNYTNRKGDTGLGGWQTNKQIIGYYRNKLPSIFEKMADGEYIKLPNVTGYLELKIGTGVIAFDYEREVKPIYPKTRYVMYKNPTITLVDKYGKNIEAKDIEQSAWLNRDAKEELTIETILGTLSKPSPTALGQFFRTSDRSVVSSFYRAGRQDLIERLLIGTIYSNYAGRNDVLSGTCTLLNGFGVYTDNNEPGTYLMLSDRQNPYMDESEVKIVKISPDSYEGVIFE